MNKLMFYILLLISLEANAESFVCTYMGYIEEKPIIRKYGTESSVLSPGYKHTVLENNEYGLIIVESGSGITPYSKEIEIYTFVTIINKKNLEMTRGNVIQGKLQQSLRNGKCIKED